MKYVYDIAISYQSEMEQTAQKIADYLRVEGFNVFFAPECQQDIMSEKLHSALYDIYRNKSFVRLLLMSDAYLSSEWTLLEKRVSASHSSLDMKRRIVVDYTETKSLPEDLKEYIFIDGKNKYDEEIAIFVSEYTRKLKKEFKETSEPDSVNIKEKAIVENNNGVIIGDHAHFENFNFWGK